MLCVCVCGVIFMTRSYYYLSYSIRAMWGYLKGFLNVGGHGDGTAGELLCCTKPIPGFSP